VGLISRIRPPGWAKNREKEKTMKHQYKISAFQNERGEAFKAIYCEDLNEMAIETGGDILCTESDALEDVLAGTPWEGSEDLTLAADWPEMTDEDYENLSSIGLRDLIDAKERGK
jgi:hypothetical protein